MMKHMHLDVRGKRQVDSATTGDQCRLTLQSPLYRYRMCSRA